MKDKRKICSVLLAGLLVVVLLATAVAGCAKPAPEEPTPPPEEPTPPPAEPEYITVGAILPLSGPISFVGMSWTRGYELYFDKINEEGGVTIGGQTYLFNYIDEDSKMSGDAAGAATRKLIHQDGATFIFGAIIEGATAAIADVASEAGVPHIICSVNIPGHPVDIGPDKPLTARLFISHDTTNTINFDYLLEAYPDVKTVAIVHPDLGYEGMVVDATYVAEQRGLEVVLVKPWDFFTTTDFVPTMTEVLAAEPDAIMCMVTANAPEMMLAARQLGYTGPMWGNIPLGPEVYVLIMGAEAATDIFTNGINLDEPTEIQQEIMDRWAAKYGEPFIGDAVLSWDGAWILVQAMEKAQSVDGEAVMAALDTMTELGDLETCFGPGYMGEGDRFGVNRVLVRPLPITRIMNGVVELIDFRYGSHR